MLTRFTTLAHFPDPVVSRQMFLRNLISSASMVSECRVLWWQIVAMHICFLE